MQAVRVEQPVDLVGFSTEADHEHRREIRMPRIAGERAPQQRQPVTLRVQRAPLPVRQRDDAIRVWIIGECLWVHVTAEVVRDRARRWPSN